MIRLWNLSAFAVALTLIAGAAAAEERWQTLPEPVSMPVAAEATKLVAKTLLVPPLPSVMAPLVAVSVAVPPVAVTTATAKLLASVICTLPVPVAVTLPWKSFA